MACLSREFVLHLATNVRQEVKFVLISFTFRFFKSNIHTNLSKHLKPVGHFNQNITILKLQHISFFFGI